MPKFVVHYTIPGEDDDNLNEIRKWVKAVERPEGAYNELYAFFDDYDVQDFMTSMYTINYSGTYMQLLEALLAALSDETKALIRVFVTPLDDHWAFYPSDLDPRPETENEQTI